MAREQHQQREGQRREPNEQREFHLVGLPISDDLEECQKYFQILEVIVDSEIKELRKAVEYLNR